MQRRSVVKRISLLFIITVFFIGSADFALGFPWSKDMFNQPSIKPYEMPITPPENTLSTDKARFPMTREELGEKVKNPVSPTEPSIANGKRLYMINCSLCHGNTGKGGGTVSKKFVPPPDLSLDFYKKKPDGFIYGTIKYGGAVMPAYGENIPDKEIWDVVNFIRVLQGK